MRPDWRPEPPSCSGTMMIDEDTEEMEIKVAECDACEFTIGIPPRQWDEWMKGF